VSDELIPSAGPIGELPVPIGETNVDGSVSRRFIPIPPDERRCTSISRVSGERCRNWASAPTTVCRYHGALALRGPAAPNYKHGQYSRAIPKRLKDAFMGALGDRELDNLKRQIALCQTRELELVARLDTNESGDNWIMVGKHFDRLCAAYDEADEPAIRAAVKAIDELINIGVGDKAQWRDIHENMEMRRSLAETERKSTEFLQANITPEMMAAFVGRVTSIIAAEVKDRHVLSRIADQIRAAAFGDKYLDDVLTAEVVDAHTDDDKLKTSEYVPTPEVPPEVTPEEPQPSP